MKITKMKKLGIICGLVVIGIILINTKAYAMTVSFTQKRKTYRRKYCKYDDVTRTRSSIYCSWF